jgi:hypothetical protein
MDLIYLFEEGNTKTHRRIEQKLKFEGQCYKCGCYKHTQRYCPLQHCEICMTFGHHERVCHFNVQNKTLHKNKKNRCVFRAGY